jgi:hypothetical protein
MALKFPDILQHNNTSYALIDSSQVRGTAYSITNLNDTGSIPSDKRNVGIIVFVSSEQKYYGYYGATSNTTDWDNTNNWRPLADGDNAISLGAIVTGSSGLNQTILGSLTVNEGIIGSASFATQSTSASYSLTASYTPNSIITASVISNTITFKKGDNTQFDLTIDTGSNSAASLLNGITNGQILYNNSNTFAGVPGVSYNGTTFIASGSFSGSLQGTASYANTASWAINALTASLVITAETSSYPFNTTGSTIYSYYSNRVGSTTLPITSINNNFIVGEGAALRGFYTSSVIIGYQAGYQIIAESGSNFNVFLGNEAGARSSNVVLSFLGLYRAGYQSQPNNSLFIGREAGAFSGLSNDSIFLGRRAGFRQTNVSHSILIGYNVGAGFPVTTVPLGSNNIIIGSNITLPPETSNSINIGGILFGKGTYSETAGNPSNTAVADGKIGINIYPTNYNLEINGTTNISNGLYVSNSINLSGSFNQIGNSNVTGNSIIIGNSTITGSLETSGSNVFTGLQTVSGSLNIMENLTVLGTASFYVFTTTYTTTSTIVATGSNTFGDTIDDTQTLVGYVNISGSLTVTGSTYLTASNVAGGQNNYIALWNSNNSLTTGSLYETGSNILIGTTTNPNSNFKLYVSGNIGSPSFQISSVSSSNNENYVGIWRPSGSTGYTNFLETSQSESQHKWSFRGINGFGEKREWNQNNSSIFNINLGWNSPGQTVFTGSTLLINPHINVNNGYATMLRGIYYNPTISASANTNHIAIETTTGSILFKNLPTTNTITNILLYDTASGQLYYTASSGIGGTTALTGSNATGSFTTQSIWNFNHGLNNKYVLVQTYDTNWSQIIPESITLTDINNVTIAFPTSESGYAIAMLGGDVSLSISGSYITNSQTGSFATTGSNTFRGNQTITGSLTLISGSSTDELITIRGTDSPNTFVNIAPDKIKFNAAGYATEILNPTNANSNGSVRLPAQNSDFTLITSINGDYADDQGAITISNVLTASYVTPYEGVWTSYTPVWTADTTNPVIGNGTIQGWYKLVGKTCFVRGNIAMGSTTTFGSGEWYVSMPFTASHADAILMSANLLDNTTAWYNATVNGARAGLNYKAPIQYQTVGGTANSINATSPFTWTDSDRFIWNGSYEIA